MSTGSATTIVLLLLTSRAFDSAGQVFRKALISLQMIGDCNYINGKTFRMQTG
jgi:hypothetical protein